MDLVGLDNKARFPFPWVCMDNASRAVVCEIQSEIRDLRKEK